MRRIRSRNLMRYIRQEVELRALTERRVIPATAEDLSEYPILFAHGRRSFRWNAAERKALADYVANGGFLFADAICASPNFATLVPQAKWRRSFPARSSNGFPITTRCSPTNSAGLI